MPKKGRDVIVGWNEPYQPDAVSNFISPDIQPQSTNSTIQVVHGRLQEENQRYKSTINGHITGILALCCLDTKHIILSCYLVLFNVI